MSSIDESTILELDVLVIGAGFGGVYQLKKLRDEGFHVKLVDCASDFGGVWHWNRYPGARVDIPIPHYEFSDPTLWRDWTWSNRFPNSDELRAYFQHVATKWDLRKDSIFNTLVSSATWDNSEAKWTIRTHDGPVFKARFFLPNTGFGSKRYIPDWPGIDKFEGTWIHPSYWPKDGLAIKGKKVAVIGTGASGIQLAQEIAPMSAEFTLFQRTPNLCLPMKQVRFEGIEQTIPKDEYAALYAGRKETFGGAVGYAMLPTATFDHSSEEREATYERLWDQGDVSFWLSNYYDMLFSDKANTEAYNFWRDKVRARINDPALKEKLAPMTKPHAFGCKRISLENGFYEIFDLPHVKLVDVNETPILEVTPQGIRTSDREFEFDYIICATGYDAITGGILNLNIVGHNGVTLRDKWADGVKTNLGMCVEGFPSMFFSHGPQAPTSFCNAPTCAELQGDWIVSALKYVRDHGLRSIEGTSNGEEAWSQVVKAIAEASLLPSTKSWYMGDNIPGKKREPLIFLGGLPAYLNAIDEAAANGYQGMQLR